MQDGLPNGQVQPPPTLARLATLTRTIAGKVTPRIPAPKAVGCNRWLGALSEK